MEHENASPSRLQADLVAEIIAMIRADALQPGTRLVEVSIAARLGVSRTPVRAALSHLAEAGVARRVARGFLLDRLPASTDPPLGNQTTEASDRLSLRISQDWMGRTLPADVSEADLMRRYEVGRTLLKQSLAQLAQVGVVERKRGHGWHFPPAITDLGARVESYRFRIVVETAALLEPGFALPPGWAAGIRERHQTMLASPWRDVSSIAFYEMNADFHQGLAAASGNRFLLQAVQQQNRLRRVSNYEYSFARSGEEAYARAVANCNEHLQILGAAETGAMEVAAAFMRLHLQRAQQLR